MSLRHFHTLFFALGSGLVVTHALAGQELYVSRHAARILPARIVNIPVPEAGEIRIHCFGEGRVNAGTLLAVLNEENLAMEEQELEITLMQQRLERDKVLYKLQKHKEELEFLQKLPNERRAYAAERMQAQPDERMLASLDEEMELLHRRFRIAEAKARQTLNKKRQLCTLHMPFTGRLQYHITLPEKEGGTVPVTSSTPVVTIVDDSAFYVVLPATDPAWSKLEHERLHLSIDLGSGEKLCASWHHQKVDKGERGEALFYYFLVPEAEKEKAFSLIGSNIVAELFLSAEPDWLYEKKTALAMEAGSSPIETWEKLIEALRPQHDIVFIGETHICMKKKDEREALPAPVPAS